MLLLGGTKRHFSPLRGCLCLFDGARNLRPAASEVGLQRRSAKPDDEPDIDREVRDRSTKLNPVRTGVSLAASGEGRRAHREQHDCQQTRQRAAATMGS